MSANDIDNRKTRWSRRQRKKHTATSDTYAEEDEKLVHVIIENLEKELLNEKKGEELIKEAERDDDEDVNEEEEEEEDDEEEDDDDDNDDGDDEINKNDEELDDEEVEEDSDDGGEQDDEDVEDEEEDTEQGYNMGEGGIRNYIEVEEIQEIDDADIDDWKENDHGDHDDERDHLTDIYENSDKALRKPAASNKDRGKSKLFGAKWFTCAFIGGLILGFTMYFSFDFTPYLDYFTNKTAKAK